MKRHPIRRRMALGVVAATAALALAACASPSSSSDSKNITIAFSQSFSSNSWQAANDKAVQTAADLLKKQGKIKKYVFADANNSVNTQISQINSMILQKVSVILIDPTSATGLNGVIAKAHAAGIPVLVFADGPVTSTIAYDMEAPLADYTQKEAQFIVDQLHGTGNVLDVRGVAGTGADNVEEGGSAKVFKANPGIKIVGTVYGSWDEATAQSAVAQVLSGLPKIDAVMEQGGSGYGIAQAFQAAGRPIPIIPMGNRGEELQFWADQKAKNNYQSISINPNPGMGASAAYIGYALATGKKVPKKMLMPNLEITNDTLAQYSSLKTGDIAYKIYSQTWTQKNVIDKGTN